MTSAEALDFVKNYTRERYQADRDDANKKLAAAEAEIGGGTRELDDSVVKQARALMQRLALLAKNLDAQFGSTTYGSATPGESKQGKEIRRLLTPVAGVVSGLELMILTDPSIGLFSHINEADYVLTPYEGAMRRHVTDYAGKKIKDDVAEIFKHVKIVDVSAAPPEKKGRKKKGAANEADQYVPPISPDMNPDDVDFTQPHKYIPHDDLEEGEEACAVCEGPPDDELHALDALNA